MLVKKLKRIRTERGLTQKQLALMTDINLRNLQNYEQCRKNVPLEMILKMCLVLGCEAKDLIEENEDVLQVLDEYFKMQRQNRKKR